MKSRIIVGGCLFLLLIVMLWAGGFVQLFVMSAVSFMGTYEVAHAITKRGLKPLAFPVYIFSIVYPYLFRMKGLISVVILYFFCIILSVTVIVLTRAMDASSGVGTLVLYLYPLSLFLCLFLCYAAFERPFGITATALACIGPSLCDTLAYFGGTLFGKHKLCPEISPHKTVEGAIFGLLGGVLGGVLLYFIQGSWNSTLPGAILMPLGLLCGFFGQVGDLFASMMKRWVEVKDFSGVLKEHGGVMDRFDSILLCAPMVLSVLYLYVILL